MTENKALQILLRHAVAEATPQEQEDFALAEAAVLEALKPFSEIIRRSVIAMVAADLHMFIEDIGA